MLVLRTPLNAAFKKIQSIFMKADSDGIFYGRNSTIALEDILSNMRNSNETFRKFRAGRA